jgi:hypothetical protein
MKRLWLIFTLLFVFSCEDKKEPDTTPPNISFISPTNGSNVEIGARNFETELNVQVNIDDNEGVLKAECFVDNVSQGVKSGSPFNWQIDAYPNLKQGNHRVQIVAEDINGNKSTQSIEFTLDVYHFVDMTSWILGNNDNYKWTLINTDLFYMKQFDIAGFGSIPDREVLKEGIYQLNIMHKNINLIFSDHIDINDTMSLDLRIVNGSYVVDITRTNKD